MEHQGQRDGEGGHHHQRPGRDEEVRRVEGQEMRQPRRSHCPHRNRRSEEHTSELQSHLNLVCRLLLEKKKVQQDYPRDSYLNWPVVLVNDELYQDPHAPSPSTSSDARRPSTTPTPAQRANTLPTTPPA